MGSSPIKLPKVQFWPWILASRSPPLFCSVPLNACFGCLEWREPSYPSAKTTVRHYWCTTNSPASKSLAANHLPACLSIRFPLPNPWHQDPLAVDICLLPTVGPLWRQQLSILAWTFACSPLYPTPLFPCVYFFLVLKRIHSCKD